MRHAEQTKASGLFGGGVIVVQWAGSPMLVVCVYYIHSSGERLEYGYQGRSSLPASVVKDARCQIDAHLEASIDCQRDLSPATFCLLFTYLGSRRHVGKKYVGVVHTCDHRQKCMVGGSSILFCSPIRSLSNKAVFLSAD